MKEHRELRPRWTAAARGAVCAHLILLCGCGTTASSPGMLGKDRSTGVHPISGVPTSITAFVGITAQGPYNRPEQISSYAQFSTLFAGKDIPDPLANAVRDFFNNGGTRGVVVRAEGEAGYENAIGSLDSVDLFNLLCILPLEPGDEVPSRVWDIAARACVKHRAMLIVDPPLRWRTPEDVSSGDAGIGSESSVNAAFYFPRIVETHDGRRDTVAPSGAVAGVFARTDAQKGVWQSPAGTSATVSGADGPSADVTDADAASLNERGINAIRQLAGRGCLIWGARTAAGADNLSSEWKYVPVRRLSLYIEESVSRGTRWAAFEPNNDSLWSQIRTSVDAFMRPLWLNGGLQGMKTEEAYFVTCDATTTSQADRDGGIVNILVGFAPVKPAEFILLKIQQLAGPVSAR